ncbi:protein of unknown function DUF820 [Rippkaea orientalis PCC 8801]|uniref:Putative restriction endonuclease domain-containing protein n=1 Tax=Rippkaea orientalis (strain PCC 8801 / RF-1) TaxID=41431 RepID=B7JXE8_RIPO1|nr:Uma2 family endonuclease [Rippkaea orientalis]ACK67136.1 protein of unknown function DUF820 [Rippkaea orientalis PCC 8801]
MQVTAEKIYSIEEYLQFEETANNKHEYINGHLYPIAGGTINHNQIALNISTELNFAFKKLNYRVYMGGVRLWVPQVKTFTYPDVMIIMGTPEYCDNRTDTVINPSILVEVLSQSRQNSDPEGKFISYRSIPSFQEYLLFDQTRIYAEHFFKTGTKSWVFQEYDRTDESIKFNSIEFELTFVDVYNKVNFEE